MDFFLQTVKLERQPISSGRHYKVNCIKCSNYGSVISGGNEGIVYILTPTNPPKVIAKIDGSGSEITSVSRSLIYNDISHFYSKKMCLIFRLIIKMTL